MLTVRWRRTRTVLLSSGSRWWISWADRVPDQVECDSRAEIPYTHNHVRAWWPIRA